MEGGVAMGGPAFGLMRSECYRRGDGEPLVSGGQRITHS